MQWKRATELDWSSLNGEFMNGTRRCFFDKNGARSADVTATSGVRHERGCKYYIYS